MYPEQNHPVRVSVTQPMLPFRVKVVSFGSRIRKLLLLFNESGGPFPMYFQI